MISGGTKYDGSYLGIIDIPAGAKEGNYVLSNFYVSDEANNHKSFSANVSSSNGVVTRNWSKAAIDALGELTYQLFHLRFLVKKIVKRLIQFTQISNIALSSNTINRIDGDEHLFLSFDAVDPSAFGNLNFTFRRINKDGSYNYDGESIYTYSSIEFFD